MKRKRIKFFVDSSGLFTHGAIIFMALAAVFTLLSGIGQQGDAYFMAAGFALPLACELLFLVLITLLGKRSMVLTALPTVMFAVYFIIKAFAFGSVIRIVVFTVLYLAAALLFTATVFGWIRSKWIVSAIIFITFAINVIVIDYPVLAQSAVSVTFTVLMREIAILFILLGLLFASLALKSKRPLEECDLPKMRSPKVSVKAPTVPEKTDAQIQSGESVPGQLIDNEPEKLSGSTSGDVIRLPEKNDAEPVSTENTEQ
ncbi:MAG: hypothetical protein Q4E35_06955 [Eubacteriales bacterium]|nr:hypothetical protein [Eubacteriales bacterium]